MTIEVLTRHYYPTPTLSRFMQSQAIRRGVRGPRGSGKSSGMCNELFKRAMEQQPGPDKIRRTRFAIIRNTYRELEDTTLKTWLFWFPEAYFGAFNMGRMSHTIAYKDMHAEFLFRALDKPKDVSKLLSLELTGGWINEAKQVNLGLVEALDDTFGRYPPPAEQPVTWSGLIMDTNSPDDTHWWYRMSEEEDLDPQYWQFFTQPGGLVERNGKFYNNPEAENLDVLEKIAPDYYQTRAAGKRKSHVRVYYCNQYGMVVDGKPVHEDYVDATHCAQDVLEPTKGLTITIGLDFGLTPAATWLQRQVNGRWIAFHETVTEHMGISRFADLILPEINRYAAKGFDFEIFGDPAGTEEAQMDERTPFQILQGKGIDAKPAHRNNDATLRREALANPLQRMIDGKPGFMISPACRVLRKALQGGYCYKRVQVTGDDRYMLKPEKNRFSHIAESCEYGLLGSGEGLPIGKIKEEDFSKLHYNPAAGRRGETFHGGNQAGQWMG